MIYKMFKKSSKSFVQIMGKINILEKDKANQKLKEFVQKYCFITNALGAKFCIVYGTYILGISYEQ